ncbi:hypothetical protein DKT77_11400 [Meridianimarinicoccus roseus]|uniref:Glycosyltransferase subfamily 4-like N-terminal domain-containing protein n=1 Tax=Meridianimarinicoccus roseus TaxID=2072018 RepID=A0A2V2LG97_9RHOB|nr:glycosyltransferase family 4 protein [Meridianimarinicoccus roseus]PWR02524.1 hypothetical protein DKT77_11400 [Meridianimarinicoccus roseus]
MKILFVSNLYPPNQVGGYEELCWTVASHLHADHGHEIAVLTSASGGRVADWPGQRVHQSLRLLTGRTVYDAFDGPPARRETIKAQNRAALQSAIQRTAPDVIFCWNLYGLDLSFYEALGRADPPVVVMLTDNWLASMIDPEAVGAFFRTVVNGSARQEDFAARGAVRQQQAAQVSAIFGAKFMKDFYSACGVTFARDEVIHNGVQLPAASTPRSYDRIADGATVRLLFAGRLVDIKGAHTAVEALLRLRSKRPGIDWRLSLVGDARDTAYLMRLRGIASEGGCLDRIDFRSPVAPEVLPDLFASHDMYVFPSLYEPFSLTLIHALASGIPTLASRVGGNVEIIRDGDTGLLFEKGDADGLTAAILRLVDTDGLINRLSTRGVAAAREFSRERMIAAMDAHLRDRVRRRT